MLTKIIVNKWKRRKYITLLIAVSTTFIIYQIMFFWFLTNQDRVQDVISNMKGVHPQRMMFYTKNERNEFKCINSMEIISYSSINDNYCDCLDGSDEPGTNACDNSEFFCFTQKKVKPFKTRIPSSMVNDGICDCCDGSDEWEQTVLSFGAQLPRQYQNYLTPCENHC